MSDREHIAKAIQQFWQGASGRPWDGTENSCCVKLPPQADWFRRLADVVIERFEVALERARREGWESLAAQTEPATDTLRQQRDALALQISILTNERDEARARSAAL